MLAVLIGIVVVVISVVEYLGHITVIHAVAILTLILGVSIILGALQDDRYHTRLLYDLLRALLRSLSAATLRPARSQVSTSGNPGDQ